MNINLWLKGVEELNTSLTLLIDERNKILDAMKVHLRELFFKHTDVTECHVTFPFIHDDELNVQYGYEIVVEVPFDHDNPCKFSKCLFDEIGWDFSMNKICNEKGWFVVFTFYPFEGKEK